MLMFKVRWTQFTLGRYEILNSLYILSPDFWANKSRWIPLIVRRSDYRDLPDPNTDLSSSLTSSFTDQQVNLIKYDKLKYGVVSTSVNSPVTKISYPSQDHSSSLHYPLHFTFLNLSHSQLSFVHLTHTLPLVSLRCHPCHGSFLLNPRHVLTSIWSSFLLFVGDDDR